MDEAKRKAMSDLEKALSEEWFRKRLRHDANGKPVPEHRDVEEVKREYPNESDAEKWRLAQATYLLRIWNESRDCRTNVPDITPPWVN